MTLVIISGEIDLSVASVVGLSSVLVGVLHEGGLPIPAAALLALAAGRGLRRLQRLPRRVRRAAVARGHHRHAGAVPGAGGRPARHPGGHRLPGAVDRPGDGQDRGLQHPARHGAVPRPGSRLHAAAALHLLRPRRLRHRAQQRGGALHRRRRAAHEAPAVRPVRRRLGAGRHLLHAALRQRPRRQRHGPGAAGHRGRAARRRLDLRRTRPAARRRRRGPAHRRHRQRPAARGRHGQRHQHHHRAAPRGLGGVHQRPGADLPQPPGREPGRVRPPSAPVGVGTQER